MYVTKVGSRGYVFSFNELESSEFNCITNVYVIDGSKYTFICDTFLGSKAMDSVMNFINTNFIPKQIIIFNSHSDWDHIWGNCYFKDCTIIAHSECRKNIILNGTKEFFKYKELAMGEVHIVPPNITFEKEIYFCDEDVTFFYSPGHTRDSASCLDGKDGILFVGDNIEYPKPYITCDNLLEYKNTLENYRKIKSSLIISGHSDIKIDGHKLLISNLEYLTNLI